MQRDNSRKHTLLYISYAYHVSKKQTQIPSILETNSRTCLSIRDAAPVTNTTVETVSSAAYKQLGMLQQWQQARLLLTLNIVSLLPPSIYPPFSLYILLFEYLYTHKLVSYYYSDLSLIRRG
jgi:hypothetical protein